MFGNYQSDFSTGNNSCGLSSINSTSRDEGLGDSPTNGLIFFKIKYFQLLD